MKISSTESDYLQHLRTNKSFAMNRVKSSHKRLPQWMFCSGSCGRLGFKNVKFCECSFFRHLEDSQGETMAITHEGVVFVKHHTRWMCHPDEADEGWCHPDPAAGSMGAISKTSAKPLANISAGRLVEGKCRRRRSQTASNHQRRTEKHPLGSPELSHSFISDVSSQCRWSQFCPTSHFLYFLASSVHYCMMI